VHAALAWHTSKNIGPFNSGTVIRKRNGGKFAAWCCFFPCLRFFLNNSTTALWLVQYYWAPVATVPHAVEGRMSRGSPQHHFQPGFCQRGLTFVPLPSKARYSLLVLNVPLNTNHEVILLTRHTLMAVIFLTETQLLHVNIVCVQLSTFCILAPNVNTVGHYTL